jgi:hypothetical protein
MVKPKVVDFTGIKGLCMASPFSIKPTTLILVKIRNLAQKQCLLILLI